MSPDLTGESYFHLSAEIESPRQAQDGFYACPCCNSHEFLEPGGWEICSVCGWEDDPVQEKFPDERGGANGLSLTESRANYLATGHYKLDHDLPRKLP
jgi:hypothetical protein